MQLESLTKIFNQRLFKIPDFQRGYSWGPQQLEDFWEDLNLLRDGKTHYTGQLTIQEIDKEIAKQWVNDFWRIKESDFTAYYVIDGQQRLTTSLILISVILDGFGDDETINTKKKPYWVDLFIHGEHDGYKSYLFGYEKDTSSDSLFFKEYILGEPSKTALINKTFYTYNLKKAHDFFKQKIDEGDFHANGEFDKKKLENLFKKLTTQFKCELSVVSANDVDIYVTFETINNRGKKLSNLELMKNRLIYLSTLFEDVGQQEVLRKDINEAWKIIYEYLGKNDKKPLNDDDFLYNHWIMSFKFKKDKENAFAKFLLQKHFTAKKLIEKEIKYDDISLYIKSLSDSIIVWFGIYNPDQSGNSPEVKEWLSKLNRLGYSSFKPLLMAVSIKENNGNTLKLIKKIEHFIFTVFRLSRRQSNAKSNDFFVLANEYYAGSISFDGVIQKIDSIRKNLVKLQKLKEYIDDHDDRFYGWDGLKYFLYEYEAYLQGSAGIKVSWDEFYSRKKEETIEHIYPQSPAGNWPEYDKYSKNETDMLCNNLGNLLLLSRAKNSSLQNFSFNIKQKGSDNQEDKIGYFNGSYSEIDVSQEPQWTEKEILGRGIKMLKFMEKRWNVDFGDSEAKKVLLNLDFVDYP